MSDEEKTEDPTPDKRRKAEEEGNFAKSKDAGSVAASAAVLLILGAAGPGAFVDFQTYVKHCFNALGRMDDGVLGQVSQLTLGIIAKVTIPIAAAAALGGVLMGVTEVGLRLNWSLLEPKASRFNPIPKLQKSFSPKETSMMTLLTLGRVFVISMVAYMCISKEMHMLAQLPRVPIESAIVVILGLVGRIAFWATLALAVMSALDYGQSWWTREKGLKMSRQEIKDEMNQQEGNPKMKGRRMQRAREIARNGLLKQIKNADVVVANPTHVAVVLRYRPEEGAPVVAAKGLDEVALIIKQMAKDHGVPVVESKQLARALYAQVKVGRVIPVELFKAVAELLAYVYRLKREKLTA